MLFCIVSDHCEILRIIRHIGTLIWVTARTCSGTKIVVDQQYDLHYSFFVSLQETKGLKRRWNLVCSSSQSSWGDKHAAVNLSVRSFPMLRKFSNSQLHRTKTFGQQSARTFSGLITCCAEYFWSCAYLINDKLSQGEWKQNLYHTNPCALRKGSLGNGIGFLEWCVCGVALRWLYDLPRTGCARRTKIYVCGANKQWVISSGDLYYCLLP